MSGIMARWFADKIGMAFRADGTIHVRGQEIGTWNPNQASEHVEIHADQAVIDSLHEAAHNEEDVDWTSLGVT